MASSEDLVPTGQPYGSRQDTVTAMENAGVPLSSEGAGGQPAPTGPPAGAGQTLAPSAPPEPVGDLTSFDVFANREPTAGFNAAPQSQVTQERVRRSNNQVLQSIFSRMSGYKDG